LSHSKYINTYLQDEINNLTTGVQEPVSNYMIRLPKTVKGITDRIKNCIEKEDYQQAMELAKAIEYEDDERKNFLLGFLYDELKKYNLAERYYLLAIEKGDEDAMYNLSWTYYIQNKNKEQAKLYFGRYKVEHIGTIIIEIWTGVFHAVEERVVAVCKEEREDALFLERLLVLHQKSLVDKLFHHAEFAKRLQEQYTVLYYASLILNGKENENNLLLRIPPELQTTVEDVLQNIKNEQERYSK
jgi:tetratricopeptide (TPR) repeat protein